MQSKSCAYCKSEYQPRRPTQQYCGRECAYAARQGKPTWNSGTARGWLDRRGYRWIRVAVNGIQKKKREHRVVVEGQLGRSLEPWEVVHHKNGVLDDNRPDNLEVVEVSAHTVQHHTGQHRPDNVKRMMEVHAQMREEIARLRDVNTDLLAACEGMVAAYRRDSFATLDDRREEFIACLDAIAKAKGQP